MGAWMMAYPQHAFVGFDDPMGQRKTQPGALIFGSEEGMKNFLCFGLGDARTGIIDRYKCIPRFLKIKSGEKEKVAPIRHGLDGIMDNVLKNLAQ